MKKIFNISTLGKLSQSDSVGSGEVSSGRNLEIKKPPVSSGLPAPASSGSDVDWRNTLGIAKRIYVEHGDGPDSSAMIQKIREPLSSSDKKLFDQELMMYKARNSSLSNLFSSSVGSEEDERVLQDFMEAMEEGGPEEARRFIEHTILPDHTHLLSRAQSALSNYENNTGHSDEAYSNVPRDPIEDTLDKVNKAAAGAISRELEQGILKDTIKECADIDVSGMYLAFDRIYRVILRLQNEKIPLFNKKDLLGSSGQRSLSFISHFVSQHSEALRHGGNPLINKGMHDFVNSHFQSRDESFPLGSDYPHLVDEKPAKPADRVRQHFDYEDGGLSAYRLPDGRYAFEHIAEDFANALNSNPPDKRAMCIVLSKLASYSQGSYGREVTFSQMSNEEGEDPQFSDSNIKSVDSSRSPEEVVFGLPELNSLLSMIKEKSEILGNIAGRVAKYAVDSGDEFVSNYFNQAISRLFSHASSLENWIAGNIFIANTSGGNSPQFTSNMDKIYKETLSNSRGIIKEKGNIIDLISNRKKHINGVESTLIIKYEPVGVDPNSRIYDQSGRRIVETKIRPIIQDVEFKDKIVQNAYIFPSKESLEVAKILNPYIARGSTYQVQSSMEQKIADLEEIFTKHPEVAVSGAQLFKANMSGSSNRIKKLFNMGDEEWEDVRGALFWLTSGKNATPDIREILGSKVLGPKNYLIILNAIAERIGKKPKTPNNMRISEKNRIVRYIDSALASGVISEDEDELLKNFVATPSTWTAGLHNISGSGETEEKVANEVNNWIKIMARMIM